MIYLLRRKVFCGYCGRRINAETGTSMNGKIKYCKLQIIRQKVIAEQATIKNQLTKEKIMNLIKTAIKKKP